MTENIKLELDLQEGFWTSTDGSKSKVHISTNYLPDDYVRLITDYENSDDVKDYINNLITANPNESYITISINPTTKEVEYSLDGSNAAKVSTTNITKFLKEEYKITLIENLNNTLNEIDFVDNSNTQEYKTQIGEKITKYKEAVKWNLVKHIFKDKTSDMAFNGLDKANFDELYLDCKNSFPSKTDEELLVEAASRMIMSNVNDFGYFSVQNYDELFDKEDGADYRFTLCEAVAKELIDRKISDFSQVEEYIKNQSKEVFKNKCLKELEKQTFLDDVEKMVDLSIDSLDKDDYLDTYSYLTEEEYDRTKYIFDNFYKIENQTGSIDLNALYDSKESVDNVVTLENGAEIRKVIESDEGEERVYYDLYDKDVCSICDGENYKVKAVIDGTYYLKGLDSEYEDSGFALSTEEYLIATKQQNQGKELGITEDDYKELADKICQAAYEASTSGFYNSFDLDEIATLADRDIDWVRLHIEKIGEALATYHNDELLLEFNPKENINLEENQIEFNFCSVGEDANELFKFEDDRWVRKSNRELEADGYIIPVDIKYSFTYKPTNHQQIAEEKQLLVDSICDLFIEGTEIVDQKTKSLPAGKFNIEFILRHDFGIEPGTDYFNLKFDNINDRILYKMNNIIKNNEKLHCFTIDSIKSFIPEEFHIRKNLVLINDETIENFSKTPKEYLKELNPEMVSFAGSSMWREEDYFISDKNNFLEIMERYPAIKNYVEKKWDLLKEKSLQHDKEVEALWEELEDIPFIEDEDGRLILDLAEPWHGFEPGTTKEEIWHYFDRNHSKGINYLVNEYESKTKELQEQSKKDGYEAGYLFDNDESIITWKDLKKIDSTFSNADFIEIIREIKESNENLSEKELKEELVFRILEDNVDWHGFDHSLIDNEQIDSGKLLDTRCYILEHVSEAVVNKQINSFEKIQNKVDELLFNDSRTKIVASTVPSIEPMQIVEEISKEEFNLEKDFRSLLLENMKTTKSPFVATHKIFEELKQKNDTERIKEFNKYLKDNNCTTKKGFEKFFSEIIGLTKKDTERKIRKKKLEREQHER